MPVLAEPDTTSVTVTPQSGESLSDDSLTATLPETELASDEAGEPQTETKITRQNIFDSFSSENLKWSNVHWVIVTWMVLVHVGALAAPFFFTWQALGVAVLLHWFTCSIGICLCYHRYLTHRSFKLKWPAKVAALFAGAVSGEGSPVRWTMVHRIHHAQSDHPGDPHSPLEGKWWSHLLWMFISQDRDIEDEANRKYVPDLLKDKTIMFFEKTYFYWLIGSGVALFALGGWPMLLWGFCVRMVFAYHSTWFVNSATHLWGYRNYETTDQSRNLWWVAILSYGEGWHNNHHAHPRVARAGHRWWEFDPTWLVIRSLRGLGLATDVDDRLPTQN